MSLKVAITCYSHLHWQTIHLSIMKHLFLTILTDLWISPVTSAHTYVHCTMVENDHMHLQTDRTCKTEKTSHDCKTQATNNCIICSSQLL